MWKLTSLFDYVLYAIVYITGDKKKNIDKSKISLTLKQHWFEVVDFEILEFEGTSMRKLTTSVDYVLYFLLYITENKIGTIDMSKISVTSKYH